ncbi:MAG TPA: ABC-2 family transporter protein [Myxococcaceae bacterium]|nr:ABC-2 family transporter protein [Myxococcaceae bacterium]
MSVRNSLRALPALARVSFAEALAYRAEMLIWVLSTTMPLVMLALWSTVASEAPVGRFGQEAFTAYFLSNFIVRQLTGSWAAWEMNYEVKTGSLSMRLLRPVEPIISYAVGHLSALPLRSLVAIPVAGVMLSVVGTKFLPTDWVLWLVWAAAMLGAWLITFLINICVGSLALYMESSLKIMEIYFVLFMVLSGYLIPVELFPAGLREVVNVLPFRFQIGLPVELMTNAHGRDAALGLLLRQWGYVVLFGSLAVALWKGGLRRYAAFGG